LTEPIVKGFGKANIGGSIWSIEGPDCPVNTRVKVIGINGMRFQVEPVEDYK